VILTAITQADKTSTLFQRAASDIRRKCHLFRQKVIEQNEIIDKMETIIKNEELIKDSKRPVGI
jgi:flagellin-specific chaperone FliS